MLDRGLRRGRRRRRQQGLVLRLPQHRRPRGEHRRQLRQLRGGVYHGHGHVLVQHVRDRAAKRERLCLRAVGVSDRHAAADDIARADGTAALADGGHAIVELRPLDAKLGFEEHRVPLKVPAAAKGNSDHAVLASLRSGGELA